MKDSVANNHPSTSTSISRIINIKLISYVIGILLWVEGGMFLICMGVSLFYQEDAYRYFLYSSGINLIIGGLLMAYGKGATTWMTRKDGYCIVTMAHVYVVRHVTVLDERGDSIRHRCFL